MTNTKLKRVVTMRAGGTPPVDQPSMWDDAGLAWVSIGDMSNAPVVDHSERRVSSVGIAAKSLPIGRPGTLLFAMYASVGAVATLGIEASWNQAILGIEPRHDLADTRFVRYWLEHLKPDLLGMTRSNTQDNLNAEQVGNAPFPLLPIAQQRVIADYLDRKTARIDELIAAKRKMIALVGERSRVARHAAVTRGLGPLAGAPRQSDLFGAVPGHWRPTKLPFLGDIRSGGTPRTGRDDFWDGDIPWASPKDVKSFDLSATEDRISSEAVSDAGLQIIDPCAVLFVARGMILAHSFPVALNGMRTTINQDMKAVIPEEGVAPRFLAHLLAGLADHILAFLVEESAHGTRVLRMDRWKEFPLYLPPPDEQSDIVRTLDEDGKASADAIAAAQQQVALLGERRQAVITAAVTGQLDIPDAA